MTKCSIVKYKKEFENYISQKSISSLLYKKFIASFNYHIEENGDSFLIFWEFLVANRDLTIQESIYNLNLLLKNKSKGYKTFQFVIDWSYSYLGPAEIICLLLFKDSYSGGKKYPDLMFKSSEKRIEVKSYINNFRVTESTSFFTDLGTIIQALVQGGFLNSLTDINNNDLRKGVRHFCESFLCPRGFIELNSKIWKLESKTEDMMVFKASSETSRDSIRYSMVRNSLRNWLGRGMLSVQLANIIDPTRSSRIQKKELREYVDNLMGYVDLSPIPLEQYFVLSGLSAMIIYDKKDKESPFRIYNQKDLRHFALDRIAQAKVSYKKKKSIVSSK
jgi:hypothetical protein